MTLYIVLYVLIICLGFIEYNRKLSYQAKNREFFLISASVIAVFSGLRGITVGDDTKNYSYWFEYLSDFSWDELLHENSIDIEIGYKLYSYSLSRIIDNPRIVIFVSSVLIVFSLFFFLYKYSENLFVSVVLFLGLNHFFTSINTYRTYLALAIVIWAYDSLLKKKYIRAILFVIVGFFFHRMSIVVSGVIILAYFLRNKRRNVIIALVLEVAAVPFIPFAINVFTSFFPKYLYYLQDSFSNASIGKLNLLLFALEMLVFVYWFVRKNLDSPEMNMRMIILSACSILRIAGNIIPLGFRFVQVLNIIMLLIVPQIISKENKNRKILIPGICIASFALYVYYLLIDAAMIVPYVFLE